MVSVSASVNIPLHHKVQKFFSGTGSPGWSWKKGCKTVVVVVVVVIATKRICNNDHISRVIPHQLLLLWLTTACRPILLKSSFHAPDTLGCIWIARHRLHPEQKVSFPWGCIEFPENSMSFSCSEKSLSILDFPGLWPPCVNTSNVLTLWQG